MKSITIAFLLNLVVFTSVTAQSPYGISFQGLALDSANRMVANKIISIKFSIINGLGVNEYVETHSPKTDAYGQFVIVIGNGNVLTGAFDLLDWPGNQYSLKTEVDVKGGSAFKLISKQQLLTVPYSFFAINAGKNGNTLTGFQALKANLSGISNSAYGYKASAKGTSGSLNNAFGEYALHNNSSSNNNAFGSSALISNTSGTNNNVFGNSGLFHNVSGSNNVAFGNASLFYNTANANTALGFRALSYTTTGQNNVGIGSQALEGNKEGTGLSAVGAYANVTDSTLTNATVIGFDAKVSTSNTMVFGNANVKKWAFGLSTTQHAIQVGVGGENGNGAYLSTGGAWTNASSILFKENFEEIQDADFLEKIKSLKVTKWRYKGTNETHIGPFSEQFKSLFELGVPNDYDHISTIDASGVAIKGVQALYNKVNSILLEFQIQADRKETEILNLERRIAILEAALIEISQNVRH